MKKLIVLRLYLLRIIFDIQQTPILSNNGRRRLLSLLGCKLHSTSIIAERVFIGSSQLEMGPNSFINVYCFLDGMAKISLGESVRIGPHVKILTGTHTYTNNVIRRGPDSNSVNSPVVIERGCWIGMGAIILPGIVVSEGCIVAAGSVLTKSTDPNGLYAGNPAIRIKNLPCKNME